MKLIQISFIFTANSANVWTGANDVDTDGTFTFAIENSPLNVASPPFGAGKFYFFMILQEKHMYTSYR